MTLEFRLTLAGRNGYRRIALYSPESSQLLWEDTGERVDLRPVGMNYEPTLRDWTAAKAV